MCLSILWPIALVTGKLSVEALRIVISKFPIHCAIYSLWHLYVHGFLTLLILDFHNCSFVAKGWSSFWGRSSFLLSFQMLKEDLEQYTGEVHLRKTGSLKCTASRLEYWTKLGQMVINWYQDLTGALPPQHTALEEIKQRACELYRQYDVRINGNNGKEWPIYSSVFPWVCQESSK